MHPDPFQYAACARLHPRLGPGGRAALARALAGCAPAAVAAVISGAQASASLTALQLTAVSAWMNATPAASGCLDLQLSPPRGSLRDDFRLAEELQACAAEHQVGFLDACGILRVDALEALEALRRAAASLA